MLVIAEGWWGGMQLASMVLMEAGLVVNNSAVMITTGAQRAQKT